MVNTRASGRKREIQCKKILEQEEWIIHLADMPHKWKSIQDIYSCFDLIGLRKKDGNAEKIYVQVKSGSTQGCKKKLKEFRDKWLSEEDIVQVWVWKKYHGFRIVEVK